MNTRATHQFVKLSSCQKIARIFFVALLACGVSMSIAQVANCPFNIVEPARGAVSDALLLNRYARSVIGDSAFVSGTGAASNTASSIRSNIQSLTSRLDIDGDGVLTTYDSQVASRIRLGYSVQAAVAGLTPVASGSRNTVALVTAFLNTGCPAPTSSGAQYWVSKTGNDSNACTQASPCLTIQRGISLLQPGDTLNIRAGTYLERSATSAHTAACDWFGTPSSLCMQRSGTSTAPITVRAAPGDERLVILDNEGSRAAIHLLANDYITISGLVIRNNYSVGVVNWGQAQNEVAEVPTLAVGIRIENNRFENTTGPQGDNVSSIAMWGSKDWVVRNNVIDGVSAASPTLASGIQSYGVINALIENNTIRNVDFGVFWKDHFVQDLANRTPWQESEIRYNDITARDTGVRIGIRGADSVEAGHNFIHHNIVRAPNGLLGGMAGAFALSGDLRLEHNVFDGQNVGGSVCVSADSFRALSLTGNMMLRCNVGLELIDYSGGGNKYVRLTASNRNVWDSDFQNIVDRYSATASAGFYTSLTGWRAVTAGQRRTVAMSNPDANSVTASFASLFANTQTYTYSATSPAIGLVGAGRNAGPYEIGNERIGADF